jgi:aldose 1-epimerase
VTAARRWNGPALRAVSDGAIGGPEELLPPVPPELDLRQPVQLVERMYDGVWTDLTLVNGLVECAALDPANGRKAVMRATPNHPNVTVFTPAWAPAACFEPWTCPPNAFNLAANGIPGHGLTVLAPGERWEGTMWLSIEAL